MYEYKPERKFPIVRTYLGKEKTETDVNLATGDNVKENPGEVTAKVMPKVTPKNNPGIHAGQGFKEDSNSESDSQSDGKGDTQRNDGVILNSGWVPLFRKSINSQVFQSEGLWKLWTWCLMKASHTEQWIPVKIGRGTTQVHLLPGQFVFQRELAAKELKMPPSTVWKRTKRLLSMGNLNSQSSRHYSVITLTNWGFYRGLMKKVTSKGTTKEQPRNNQTPESVDGSGIQKRKNVKKKDLYSLTSIEVRLSELLLNLILERRNGFKRPDPQKWARHIDLMLRVDKRDPEEIEKVIQWCQGDEFWQNNILSTAKLRKQYDQLAMKMGEQTNEIRWDEKRY